MHKAILNKDRQQGVALLATLILITALVLTLGNIFYKHQVDVSRLSKMLHQDQALLMAISVESWAGQLLSKELDDPTVDSLEENWSIAVPVLPVEGGFIRGCIVDLQSRINLNSFASYTTESWLDEMGEDGNGLGRSWLRLLESLSLPSDEALAVSIIDWTDEDLIPLNSFGAEQLNYDANRSPVRVLNSALSDVTELSIIRGYDRGMVQRLEPLMSALPQTTAININTASEVLLSAIGGYYAQGFTDFTLQNRPFASLEDFHQGLADTLGLAVSEVVSLWQENFVSVNSDYFELNLQVNMGEVTIEVHSIIDRHNRDEALVIRRSVTTIPAILPGSMSSGDEETIVPVFCANPELANS